MRSFGLRPQNDISFCGRLQVIDSLQEQILSLRSGDMHRWPIDGTVLILSAKDAAGTAFRSAEVAP
jgi:hypothetical protein